MSAYTYISSSPLYVYSSTFTSPPEKDALIQVLSLIIWSLTIMVTIKYVLIILRADNEGEGGTFSCYSLLTRFVRSSLYHLTLSCIKLEPQPKKKKKKKKKKISL
jgi:K+ transporter